MPYGVRVAQWNSVPHRALFVLGFMTLPVRAHIYIYMYVL